MHEIINFLKSLHEHNDREWFNAHKEDYLKVKSQFEDFVEQLIAAVRGFDDSVGPLTANDCTWRIYRDTRFSKDKRPYKTHMGCFIAPGGKKGPFSGYYFQIGVSDEDGSVGGMLATGNYFTEPKVLNILREDITLDCAESFEGALRKAKGFRLDDSLMLKRYPKGFAADEPYSRYYLYKNFCLLKEVKMDYLLSSDLQRRLAKDFKSTKEFLSFLNRAVDYSLEES